MRIAASFIWNLVIYIRLHYMIKRMKERDIHSTMLLILSTMLPLVYRFMACSILKHLIYYMFLWKRIIEWFVKAIIDNLTNTKKAKSDALTKYCHNLHHSKHKNIFPRTNFLSGYTNLKNVRASKWVGILYLLVILSQSGDGWILVENVFQRVDIRNFSDV